MVGFCIIMLMMTTITALSVQTDAEQTVSTNAEMQVTLFGASFITGIRQVGFSLRNAGGNPNDETIHDISWTFTVKSIADDSIDFSYLDEVESMAYNEESQFLTNAISGSGPVTLSISASSSNPEEVSKTIKGYQIGPITLSQNFFLSELIQ